MITEPTDEQLEKWGRKAMQICPAGVTAKQPEPTPDKREEDRLRKIAGANGDRIVKNKIDQSYQLVDVATGRVVWPAHVGTSRIGATFKELREFIYGNTESWAPINTPEGLSIGLVDHEGEIYRVVSAGLRGHTRIGGDYLPPEVKK